MGDVSTAWESTRSTVFDVRNRGIAVRGNEWWGPSEMQIASSLAAA